MSLLSGKAILAYAESGLLVLDPLPAPADVNPNSVNLTLGPTLRVYEAQIDYLKWVLDSPRSAIQTTLESVGEPRKPHLAMPESVILRPHRKNPTRDLSVEPTGRVLYPGLTYLGHTVEAAGSVADFAPVLEGRSTWARLGLQTHLSAGWGDVGFRRQWVLEIQVASPVEVFPGIPICQVAFHRVEGPQTVYTGRYANQTGPAAAEPLPAKDSTP